MQPPVQQKAEPQVKPVKIEEPAKLNPKTKSEPVAVPVSVPTPPPPKKTATVANHVKEHSKKIFSPGAPTHDINWDQDSSDFLAGNFDKQAPPVQTHAVSPKPRQDGVSPHNGGGSTRHMTNPFGAHANGKKVAAGGPGRDGLAAKTGMFIPAVKR